MKHEVIFKEDLIEIFGKRPWDKEEEVKPIEPQADKTNDVELEIVEHKEEHEVAENTENEVSGQENESDENTESGERVQNT